MPLNKLENFIKNAEGRILYVNPNDLDSTDGIENQGNSLTKPFKTIQRALIEAARFSYLKGNDNDFVERTTILLFPGEHVVDNRPGFGIKSEAGQARAVSPSGNTSGAINTLSLTLDSNFDLSQENNILYKFNSVNGGVVIPRGTSIVGLDLRKTKIRPKYVPNPTDPNAKNSAIFRITGACYFWQFTLFDGNELETVYTDPENFSSANRSKPTFSHHKLTCFEYADGITKLPQFSDLTDLDIYYSKLSNAYNKASANREITQKYPSAPKGFAPQRPEFEIVGAFATDPLNIVSIESGDGATPGQVVTVRTAVPHNFTGGTPIKIRGVNVADYNISTKVSSVLNDQTFTYLLPFVRANLPAGVVGGLSAANAQVLVETDTVSGASPYIFNISLRSVYGMQGMHADGKKATGFRSMVVAQFTAVSLQKDDRAFVKYDKTNRTYSGIQFSKQTGELLSSESSSTNPATAYHLDQEANYRKGFRTTHIKVSNDSVVQIVSVFAIGFHSHFNIINGGDASITNSNSNFGTFALAAEGFKKEAFSKDDKGFVTSIITPRSVESSEKKIDYLQIDKDETTPSRFYLFEQEDQTTPPSHFAQGYRIGARIDDKIYIDKDGSTNEATILMSNGANTATTFTSEKKYVATHSDPTANQKSIYTIQSGHDLQNSETIRIIADNGNLPENIDPHKVYFAITSNTVGGVDTELGPNQIRIASSVSNAQNGIFIDSVAGVTDQYNIISRVSDKKSGDFGHPIQYDTIKNQWFIHTSSSGNTINANGTLYANASNLDISYFLRREDNRSLDEKIYKLRYVVPKELTNGKDPSDGFVLQDSSSTNVVSDNDFIKDSIESTDFDFNRNTRFISVANFISGPPARIFIRTDKPHNVNVGEQVIIKNVKCSLNVSGLDDQAFNGTFLVTDRISSKEFQVSNIDVEGVAHSPGTFDNTTGTRNNQLPRILRNDNKENLFVYRSEVITPYIENVQDGIYHLFVLNSNNKMIDSSDEFSEDKFNQSIVNLYPQYDRDNIDDNPAEATSFAKNFPIGDVVTNDLKKSITRESTNNFMSGFDVSNTISSVIDSGTTGTLIFDKEHDFGALKHISPIKITGGANHEPLSGQVTHYNVKLLNDTNVATNSNWDGATAEVTILNGVAIAATITEGGSAYTNGEQLYFDSADVSTGGIGGVASGYVETEIKNISNPVGNYVQVTGITTGTDSYHRISGVNFKDRITVHKHTSDTILDGQQVIDMGPVVSIANTTSSVPNITVFNTTEAHGLLVGNSFRILDASDQNLGDFVVKTVTDVNTFTATTKSQLTSPTYILKHGLSANNASSGAGGENIGVRGLSVYDHEFLISSQQINPQDTSISVTLANGDTTPANITQRFPIGSYIQVNEEIMRVSKKILGANNSIQVIRGVLGSRVDTHPSLSRLNKIKPLPIEFRRPSILRASGHTFEYVGYGPGNYSTALPQLQNRTLSEREEFLSQAQETSCGNVVYTGMNDKGDFYIGNTKIASASGQQTTFDIPVPTITGEDPNRLSIVADEVIVKERLLVEGGSSKNILSQFDGPVTFNGTVRNNSDVTVEGKVRINNTTPSTNKDSGALVINGGVGIEENLFVGKNITASSATGEGFFGNGAGLTNTGAELNASGTNGDTQRIVMTHLTSGTMTDGTTDGDLTFTASTNTLNVTNINATISGNVTGNLTGNADSASTAANLSFGSANRVVFKNGSNNGATSSNLTFDGTTLSGTGLKIKLNTDKKLTLGNNNDLEILHDPLNSIIREVGDGSLYLQSNQSVFITKESGSASDVMASFDATGTSALYWMGGTNSGKKIETTSDGAKITGKLFATDDIVAFSTSDIRLKENISPIENALNMINSLSGNTFDWKGGQSNRGMDTGILAQEVEALGLPGITATRDDGTKAVRYERLIPVLIEAVKELTAKVKTLENK